MDSPAFYDKPEVARLTTLSTTTLWRMIRAGDFPAPVQISKGRVAWSATVVHEWIDKKIGKTTEAA